jgi:general stress protein 26
MHTDAANQGSVPEHEARERLWSLIKDIRFAMFTARRAGSGHLHSWPMTTQNSKVDEDSSLWFFMSRKNEPVADILEDPVVNVVYADPARTAMSPCRAMPLSSMTR